MTRISPKVSVLMSVYNGARTLERCVNSILNQTYTDFEFVIVNDGSTDGTLSYLEQLDDERLRILTIPHSGLAKGLNYGLTHCQGDFIARMDADDWSHPQRLEKQVSLLFNKADIGLVSSLVAFEGDVLGNEGYAHHVEWLNTLIDHEAIQRNRFEDSPVAHPSVMFRKSLIEKYGGYSEDTLPEDYDLWLRFLDNGVRFQKVEQILLHWYDSPSRISRNLPHYDRKAFFEVKSAYLSRWIKAHFMEKPRFMVFGTGKSVKKKILPLESLGFSIDRYIEVVAPPYVHHNLLYYKDLPPPDGNTLVLSYIGDRTGKKEVRNFLNQSGYSEGSDFWVMA